MDIEIVEYYPITKNGQKGTGTFHVYVIDYGIDIRGMRLSRNKDVWHILFPTKTTYDNEEKKEVSFPVFQFTDKEKNESFRMLCKEKLKEYLLDKWNNFPDIKKIPFKKTPSEKYGSKKPTSKKSYTKTETSFKSKRHFGQKIKRW